MPNSWFSYIGGNPSVPSSYKLCNSEFGCNCTGSQSLCAIYARVATTSVPIFTTTLLAAISQAIAGNPQPNAIDKDE